MTRKRRFVPLDTTIDFVFHQGSVFNSEFIREEGTGTCLVNITNGVKVTKPFF